MYKLTRLEDFHLYEVFQKDKEEQIKLMLDIDVKTKNLKTKDNMKFFSNVLDTALKDVNKHLKVHGKCQTEPKIIILTAHRKQKLSVHIIYTNICFKNMWCLNQFMSNLKCPLINKDYLDMRIYHPTGFRMIWNNKRY